ncbi:toll-like receptor Tollo isoform X1 [Aricia agestis]|uniref:toll-like receptor Tollo isoform X1 n=1 Tax=Aricia agestis TaxID=91739 RepID=UPI001C20929C|nr:toll-like receptor Tollo isoform X1 [Aricia agestis]
MWFASFLWLLLCYSQYGRGTLLEDYEEITRNMLSPPEDKYSKALPVEIGKDKESGCLCRATKGRKTIVCFGNYECKKFPKLTWRCDNLLLRTTVIQEIHVGELDSLYFLKDLKLEANYQLRYIQPGAFQNLTELQNLTISYHTHLVTLHKDLFRGLVNLEELTLINNGFANIVQIVPAFLPNNLPSLRMLDLSKNLFEEIPENTFIPMEGTQLERLHLKLCRIDYIHPKTFLPLKLLTHLDIGSNELNCSIISGFLGEMYTHDVNLTYLDLSDMGFRKRIPMKLLNLIANTTINTLMLAYNQFEILTDDAFPVMKNIQTIDLRKVSAISIGAETFAPEKFPNLRILLLGENNLPGIHIKHIPNQQVRFLDLSGNKGPPSNPMYYEIDRDVFIKCVSLEILNLSFNRIKSIYDYTFIGLKNLKILNLENGTIYFMGPGTFSPLKHLENLNLANNNYITDRHNLTSAIFEGLNKLKVLNMKNCGLKRLYDDDNIFKMMPNLTHLILKNNQISYITDKLLEPLKLLQFLDLSENLMVSWWRPVFTTSGVRLQSLLLTNNKISELTKFMIDDLIYLLRSNFTVEIDFSDNVFVCDCSAMYKTYIAMQGLYGGLLENYIDNSNMLCSTPDVWENHKVSEYISTIKNLHCIMYKKVSKIMLLVWTAPSLFTLIFISSIVIVIFKHRFYVKYWLFLAKLALGRRFIKTPVNNEIMKKVEYKYDAFISYSNEDRDFVSEMVSNLEGTPPYLKLCVYERDFEIGSFISESILSSINESRYVLLVISENFAKSQWCRWETQLAEYHRLFLEDGTVYDPLVLIRISDIGIKYMTTTLKFLLKTKVYLTWNENKSNEFWEKLRKTLTKNKQYPS